MVHDLDRRRIRITRMDRAFEGTTLALLLVSHDGWRETAGRTTTRELHDEPRERESPLLIPIGPSVR